MKNYIEHIKNKPPHERRQHAMQMSGIITAVLLLVWITTLGVRFASTPPQTASTDDPSQLAAVAESAAEANGQATLIVASSSASNYNNSPQQ